MAITACKAVSLSREEGTSERFHIDAFLSKEVIDTKFVQAR